MGGGRYAVCIFLAACAMSVWGGERPVLVLGYPEREKQPYIADAPSDEGIFKDILSVAAARIGAELRIERLPKKRVFQYMREGRVDLYPGSPTPDRDAFMAWISLGFQSKNVCLVRADVAPFAHLRDAPPMRLIYEVGDSRAHLPKRYPQLQGIAAAAQMSTDDGVRMLRNDYGDLFVTQRETYLYYIKNMQLGSLEYLGLRYSEDCLGPARDYVIGVSKRSRHYAEIPVADSGHAGGLTQIDPGSLIGRLRQALQEMQASGEAQRLVDRRLAR